jgi:hypothetical protein
VVLISYRRAVLEEPGAGDGADLRGLASPLLRGDGAE